ncbi:hypothetical protein HY419_01130, partial [candidate division WWE3 bacterium]|nr:hypothetical protein [candidate division WWE3 bacterium]
ALNDYIFAHFQALENYLLTSLVNILPALAKLIFAFLLLFLLTNSSLEKTFFLYVSALLSSSLLIPLVKSGKTEEAVYLKDGLKDLALLGFPAGIAQALILALPVINNSILLATSSFTLVADFSLAEKIASIFAILAYSIFTVMLPQKAKEVFITKFYDFKHAIILSFVVGIAVAITYALSEPVISSLFGEKYLNSIPILKILAVSAGINSIFIFMENYFLIFNKTGVLLRLNSLRVLGLVILGSFLALNYGPVGLAIANLAVALLTLVALALEIYKIHRANAISISPL